MDILTCWEADDLKKTLFMELKYAEVSPNKILSNKYAYALLLLVLIATFTIHTRASTLYCTIQARYQTNTRCFSARYSGNSINIQQGSNMPLKGLWRCLS